MGDTSCRLTSNKSKIAWPSSPRRCIGCWPSLSKTIVGQKEMISRLLVGLLSEGHILLEGVPGLAKTTAIKSLAQSLATEFRRIQFTPDLLPADLIGTMIYVPSEAQFRTRKGPIFANFILADEINRAPSKVQSALLEAMQERQVTIGDHTYPLPGLFLVMATQNPIEQEGTYPLPEAQVDRFMLKVKITYPAGRRRAQGSRHVAGRHCPDRSSRCCNPPTSRPCKTWSRLIYIDDQVKQYILNLARSTRDPAAFGMKNAQAADRVRRIAPGVDLPGSWRPSDGLPARPRLRHAARR